MTGLVESSNEIKIDKMRRRFELKYSITIRASHIGLRLNF